MQQGMPCQLAAIFDNFFVYSYSSMFGHLFRNLKYQSNIINHLNGNIFIINEKWQNPINTSIFHKCIYAKLNIWPPKGELTTNCFNFLTIAFFTKRVLQCLKQLKCKVNATIFFWSLIYQWRRRMCTVSEFTLFVI